MAKLSEKVLELLKSEPFRAFKTKEIQRLLDVPHNKYSNLRDSIRGLVRQSKITKLKKGRYSAGHKSSEIVGDLHVNAQGYGFIKREKGEDVFVSQKNMGQALHKDKVRVRLFASSSGKNAEGQVVEVLERARSTLVGTFRWGRKYGYIVPDDIKIQRDVIILPGDDKDAQEGQKVICEILEWEHHAMNPSGKVVQILGFADEPGVDILSVIARHEIDVGFPDFALKQAESIPAEIPKEEIQQRLDLRDETIFTIDPESAKDFDDAVSLEKLEDGKWRLGVHIADVSYYVREKAALDRVARDRGTSVYLVDRVIPMLPERISNELCSLEESKDKLTFSVLVTLNPKGKVLSYDIRESIINSKKRFTYKEAQQILDGELKSPFSETLQQMRALMNVLIKKRQQRGSIDFDTVEVEIPLNDKGEPLEIRKRERLETNRLIEEFMLLANETVAKHIAIVLKKKLDTELPFVYRIHEKPDKESVNELVQLAKAFGISITPPARLLPRFFQKLAKQFQEHPAAHVLQNQLLRTMMKAQYSTQNIGHFGLAYHHYTHFTSPIRRYPDLTVHRLLKKYLQKDFDVTGAFYKDIEKICKKSTDMEIHAQEAERDSVKLKQIEYLERHLNEEFDGLIVRIVNFGFFVELPDLLVDGLVHVSSLGDDYYIIDEKNYRLYGENSGREFKLGQTVRVRLDRVDRNENLVDFVIAGD